MNLRDKKGSISIFVLVALLFMAGFLIISFASNVNKSKTIKEQFNIISGIYSYTNGEEGAYDKAYTDLRNKNKQTMTASSENSSTLELTKTFDENMSNYRIYGNSVQNGTPTPEAPIEVQSVGDKTKNILNIEPMLIASNWIADSSLNSSGYWNYPIKNLKPNTTYTLSMKENGWNGISDNGLYVTLRNNVGVFAEAGALCHTTGQKWYCKSKVTITSNENGMLYLAFYNPTDERLALFFSKCPEMMIEEGSSNTSYEPYGYKIPVKVSYELGNEINTNIYLNEPLRKIGDYADYIDFESKKVVRNIKETILDGTENWKKSIYGTNCYYLVDYDLLVKGDTSTIYSNCFKGVTWNDRTINENNIAYMDTTYNSITFRNTEHTSINSFIDFLKNNSVKVDCVLTTPKEEPISLPELKTYEDYTKIEVLTEVAPSKIEATYQGYTLD